MSQQRLPAHVDPIQMANTGLSLTGSLPLTEMDRLRETVVSPTGKVEVELKFGIDEQGIRYLAGHIKTCVKLVCQRCLKDFDYNIDSHFLLSPVGNDEEMKALPVCYEPLMITEKILTKTIVEDEILLSLPIIPLHDPSECEVKLATVESKEQKRSNPFSKLAELKSKKR